MAFIVLGKCMVGYSRNEYKKIINADKKIKTATHGVHIIVYDTKSKDTMYVSQTSLAMEAGANALKVLHGYTVDKEGKFVLDDNTVGFRGQLITYTNETADNYWAIVALNDEAVKLINFIGDIKVVNTDNFKRLRLFNRIVNVWEKEDTTIDISRYDKLEGAYQIVEIKTDDMEVPVDIEIEKSLKENDIDVDIKKVAADLEEKKAEEQKKQAHKDIGHKTLQSIASIAEDKVKQIHEDKANKYNIYKYIIENIQYLDVISIPNDIFKQLSTQVHKVLSSTFKSNGDYRDFKWIATIKFDVDSDKSVIGVVQFDETSEYIKLQAFSVYEFTHVITPSDIDTMYTKRKMEMKYL